jgi:hypothetical protein
MNAEGRRFTLVRDYLRLKLTLRECRSQFAAAQLQIFGKLGEYFDFSNVLTAFEERAKHSFVIVIESVHSRGPLRGLMSHARSRLDRRQLHGDPELFGQWINAITPHTRQVITTRIQGRNRLGSQFERFPDNLNIRTSSL